MDDDLYREFKSYAATLSPTTGGDFKAVRRKWTEGRRRKAITGTMAAVVAVVVVVPLAATHLNRSSTSTVLPGGSNRPVETAALSAHTWYLGSVTRLGRTWTPQARSTLVFPKPTQAVTNDGTNTTQWRVRIDATGMSATTENVSGEGESPLGLQIQDATSHLLGGQSRLTLAGDSLAVAQADGALQYSSSPLPSLAPPGAIHLTLVAESGQNPAGTPPATAGTAILTDQDGLVLWSPRVTPAGATVTDLAVGRYTVAATVAGKTCAPEPVSVASGSQAEVQVPCSG